MLNNNSDNLIDLLEAIGLNITHLDFYAVDQIDLKAVAMISIYCRKLGWYNYRVINLHNQLRAI